MGARAAAVTGALGALLLAVPATGLDQPIDAEKLVLRRTGNGNALLFVSRDGAFLFPALGGVDDPAAGSPGGAHVDLFSAGEGVVSLAAPREGWSVRRRPVPRLRYRGASSAAPLRLLVLKEGRLLKIVAASPPFPLTRPQGTVGIRLTAGARRSCAFFDATTVRKDEAGRFVARDARAATLADCSDTSLSGATTTTSTTTTSSSTTFAPCGVVFDPVEPMCGGVCPVGSRCVGEIGPDLSPTCGCLPDGVTPCLGSGFPACGGGCAEGRVCQAFHLLPGPKNPDVSGCICVQPGSSCESPPGTCSAVGACPAGQVCAAQGPPTRTCECVAP
jgi:hypothetical protein